mmetsp:Transcript_56613/g.143318  ORF Transcript_56613/g.143318 Transcript_56613/m.143318 type:complete len:413 (+) Transcript_56613:668-1906(+)
MAPSLLEFLEVCDGLVGTFTQTYQVAFVAKQLVLGVEEFHAHIVSKAVAHLQLQEPRQGACPSITRVGHKALLVEFPVLLQRHEVLQLHPCYTSVGTHHEERREIGTVLLDAEVCIQLESDIAHQIKHRRHRRRLPLHHGGLDLPPSLRPHGLLDPVRAHARQEGHNDFVQGEHSHGDRGISKLEAAVRVERDTDVHHIPENDRWDVRIGAAGHEADEELRSNIEKHDHLAGREDDPECSAHHSEGIPQAETMLHTREERQHDRDETLCEQHDSLMHRHPPRGIHADVVDDRDDHHGIRIRHHPEGIQNVLLNAISSMPGDALLDEVAPSLRCHQGKECCQAPSPSTECTLQSTSTANPSGSHDDRKVEAQYDTSGDKQGEIHGRARHRLRRGVGSIEKLLALGHPGRRCSI